MDTFRITSYKDVNLPTREKEFNDCMNFIKNKYDDKLIILYGLYYTGKTTLLHQLAKSLNEKSVIIEILSNYVNLREIKIKMNKLVGEGKKYFFIDEITRAENFESLIDYFIELSIHDCRIILSGTDSLRFVLSNDDDEKLHNLSHFVRMNFISYIYYRNIIKKMKNIEIDMDTYIQHAGIFQNITLETAILPDSSDTKIYYNEYIKTGIVRNIQNSIVKKRYYKLDGIKELYDENLLTDIIMNIIQDNAYLYIKDAINDIELNDVAKFDGIFSDDLDDEFKQEVIKYYKDSLGISTEKNIKMTEKNKSNVLMFLSKIDIFKEYDVLTYKENGTLSYGKKTILTQPKLRYVQILSILELLQNRDDIDKKKVYRLYSDCVGKLFEECIIYNTIYELREFPDYQIFKFRINSDDVSINKVEFDMIIRNKNNNTVNVYEIKHSKSIKYKWIDKFRESKNINIIEKLFGNINSMNILYNGKDSILRREGYSNIFMDENINRNKKDVYAKNINNFLEELRNNDINFIFDYSSDKKDSIFNKILNTYVERIKDHNIDFSEIPFEYRYDNVLITALEEGLISFKDIDKKNITNNFVIEYFGKLNLYPERADNYKMIPEVFRTNILTKKVLKINPDLLYFVPEQLKTIDNCLLALQSIDSDYYNLDDILSMIPQKMLNEESIIKEILSLREKFGFNLNTNVEDEEENINFCFHEC